MGDRGNVGIKGEGVEEAIWFYSHSHGSDLHEIVQNFLAKRMRWSDGPYFAACFFKHYLIQTKSKFSSWEELLERETGCGIGNAPMDPNHNHILIDLDQQKVSFIGTDNFTIHKEYSFEEYLALNLNEFEY